MINITNKTTPPLSRENLSSLNNKHGQPLNKDIVSRLNLKNRGAAAGNRAPENNIQMRMEVAVQQKNSKPSTVQQTSQPRQQLQAQRMENFGQPVVQCFPDMCIPVMQHLLRKGQKTPLSSQGQHIEKLKACFGWNILDSRCDMDASSFLIAANGKVLDESWFVFYGQANSPDGSVKFLNDASGKDRETISIDLGRINPAIQKIVFVLTINEAFENNLNFSMIKDAYVRLLDGNTNQELVSYRLEEYYPNVTSMTIGELYLHNGQWKFNPVGNGVHQDLAGQCAIYGVEIG